MNEYILKAFLLPLSAAFINKGTHRHMHIYTHTNHKHEVHTYKHMDTPLFAPRVFSCQPQGLLPPVNLDFSCLGSILTDANITASLERV